MDRLFSGKVGERPEDCVGSALGLRSRVVRGDGQIARRKRRHSIGELALTDVDVGGRRSFVAGGENDRRPVIVQRGGLHIPDVARQHHRERIVLRDRDHRDGLGVEVSGRLTAGRGAGVDDAFGVGRAGQHGDIECARVDLQIDRFARDISDRPVGGDLAPLLDPRSDERHVRAGRNSGTRQRVVDHGRLQIRRATEVDRAVGIEEVRLPRCRVERIEYIVGRQDQSADVDRRVVADDEPVRRIEPHVAASALAFVCRDECRALDRAVEADRAYRRGQDPVQYRVVLKVRAKGCRGARGEEIDHRRSAGIGRSPVDDGVR